MARKHQEIGFELSAEIVFKLKEVCRKDEEKGIAVYKAGWSDARLAKLFKESTQVIALRRFGLFGPLKAPKAEAPEPVQPQLPLYSPPAVDLVAMKKKIDDMGTQLNIVQRELRDFIAQIGGPVPRALQVFPATVINGAETHDTHD